MNRKTRTTKTKTTKRTATATAKAKARGRRSGVWARFVRDLIRALVGPGPRTGGPSPARPGALRSGPRPGPGPVERTGTRWDQNDDELLDDELLDEEWT